MHITLRMLKCNPNLITAFMKTHANINKIFLIRVFWFKYIFPIKFKIRILDLMLLLENSVPFEGQYYSKAGDNYGKCSKILKTLLFLFSNKMLVIMSEIHKMFLRIPNREDPDQTSFSEV